MTPPPNALTHELTETILAVILSYCSAADLIQVLELENPTLLQAVRLALSNAPSLNGSFLLELDRCRNHGTCSKKNARKDQEACIVRLLSAMQNAKVEYFELTGLRHVVGDQGNHWLANIFQGKFSSCLTSIDFSGCAMLDPKLVQAAVAPPRSDTSSPPTHSTIQHLSFQGCYRIDAAIVLAIAKSERFSQLQSLRLGGCSQTIGDECVHAIVTHLRQLRCLNLEGLKHITEQASFLFQFVPETLECLELAGCELLRFSQLVAWGRDFRRELQEGAAQRSMNRVATSQILSKNFWNEHPQLLESSPPKARAPLPNLTRINFNGLGTPRRGLAIGALPYFAVRSMGNLREIHLSGCEHIHDWEVQVLAVVCANSLTCLEMRACCIGDDAVRALGLYCTQLADADFSACFQISDVGMLAFCRHQGVLGAGDDTPKRRRAMQGSSTMRSLRVAALPQLTNDSVRAIAALKSLILLDISRCPQVTSEALAETMKELKSLVECEATGIGKWSSSVAALYSYDDDEPSNLRFVNGKRFQNKIKSASHTDDGNCYEDCIVRRHSKRFPTKLQPMYHCLDCKLLPSLNRGICYACAVHCHKNHRTFAGSLTRFYCDCAFGIAGSGLVCQTASCGTKESANYDVNAVEVYT